MIAGSLEIQLYADLARIKKDMDDARRIVGNTMSSISGMVDVAKKALGALGGAMSVNAFAGMINGAINASAALHDMSIQTGASVASLMAFRSVAATSDTSIEGISGAMNKLAKGMSVANEESKGMGQAIKAIGLDFDNLKAMTPDQQMLKVAVALDKFQDGAGKSAVAMTLFGREGAKMLPFLADLADQSSDVAAKLTEQEIAARKAQAAMADDFGDNVARVKESFEGLKRELAGGMLPALNDASAAFLKAATSAGGLNDAVKQLVADGSIDRWTRGAIAGVTGLANAVVPAAKIWAAYYASFVVAPAAFAAVATAIGTLQVQLALARMEMASGATMAALFSTSLNGVSVSAQMAAGGLGVLKVAAGTLFAAFAGWEIGSYLRDNFVEARVAGLAFVGATLTGWENVKYGAEMAWEGIKFAWDKTVSGMKSSFADYLSGVAKGLSVVGASDTSKQVEAYAESLRKAATSQGSFATQTAGITSAHKAAVAAIDKNIVDLITYEYAANNAATAAKAATPALKGVLNYDGNGDANKALEKEAALLAELSGLSGSFMADWNALSAVYAKGKISLEGLTTAQADLLAKQPGIKAAVDAEIKAREELEKFNKQYNEGLAVTSDLMEKSVEDAVKEAEKNEELARTFGLTKSAIEAQELARLEEQLAQRASMGLTLDEIETLKKLIDAKTRSVAATGQLDEMEAARKAGEDLDKFLDPAKAQTFGEALRTAFGSAGDSLTKLTGALQNYGIRQAEIEKQRGNAALAYLSGQKTEKAYLSDLHQLDTLRTKNQLAGYGDMAGAAAGFFGEHSRGYQALTAVSQVFHAAELAMTTAELVPKAISAVLSQGSGDPYSAFGRMAAMAAIVAGLGVAIGGIGGGVDTTAKDRQAANGTGTILGDSKAKSESISKALEAIDNNTYQGLTVSMGMLDALRAIQSGIGGLGNILIRTNGFSTETAATQFGSAANLTNTMFDPMSKFIGNKLGGIPSKIANAIFGGNVHSIDTGLTLQALSLGQIASSGASVSQYNDTKKDGGWFSSDKYATITAALGAEVNDQFTKILLSMRDGITEAGKALGLSGDTFNAQLNSFVVDLGKISTKDMKPADVQAALEAALSKAGDDMAKFAVAGLQKFQKAGEGYLETLTRIANDYQTVDVVMQSLGMAFNAVGMGSVAARERLIELSGGLEKFASSSEQFLRDFYTDQERAAALKTRIDPILSQYGLSTEGYDPTKVFRDFVKGLDTTTESGAQAYTTLIGISSSFKQIVEAGKEIQEQQAEAIQKIKDAASGLLGDVDNAFSVLQRVTEASIKPLQARIDKERVLSAAIRSTLDGMKVQGSEMADRASAQAQIRAALAIAKSGGALPDADALKKALSAVTQDASSQFATQQDYLRDFYQTQNDIAALGDLADSALSVDEKSLNALTGMLDAAQHQIDLLKGIDVSSLTIAQAMAGLQTALGSAKANPIVSATSGISGLYQSLLGRAPDAAGLAYWQEKAAGGVSMDAIARFIKESNEYKTRIPGFANGGDFMGGLRIVGENGPELESTGPSRITNSQAFLSQLASPSQSNAVLAAAVERLTAKVESQQAALDKIANNTKQFADQFDQVSGGGGALLVENA